MMSSLGRAAALAVFVCLCGSAQNRQVDSRNQHERVIALVPFVGSGTMEDPKRPMFAPRPGEVDPGSRTGIVAFHFIPTDDGSMAIVELIARDKAAFATILTSNVSGALFFLRGRDDLATMVTALQKYRKDFSLDSFGLAAKRSPTDLYVFTRFPLSPLLLFWAEQLLQQRQRADLQEHGSRHCQRVRSEDDASVVERWRCLLDVLSRIEQHPQHSNAGDLLQSGAAESHARRHRNTGRLSGYKRIGHGAQLYFGAVPQRHDYPGHHSAGRQLPRGRGQ
jgi:hypothetical protein